MFEGPTSLILRRKKEEEKEQVEKLVDEINMLNCK
jgi:hypothetical protein